MRELIIDIETSPNLAYVWGMFKQNVALNQIEDTGEVISFAAKWRGEKKVHFASTYHDGKVGMLDAAHALLDEADVVIGYNSKSFDMKHLRREFLLNKYAPPSPWQDVDLLTETRRLFRFVSNKLDHVSQQLGIGSKVKHEGFDLWKSCIVDQDEAAWGRMRKYNKQDVVLTEKLYEIYEPWAIGIPNKALMLEHDGCPRCGAPPERLQSRGFSHTKTGSYRRFQCTSCGGWSKAARAEKKSSDKRTI